MQTARDVVAELTQEPGTVLHAKRSTSLHMGMSAKHAVAYTEVTEQLPLKQNQLAINLMLIPRLLKAAHR